MRISQGLPDFEHVGRLYIQPYQQLIAFLMPQRITHLFDRETVIADKRDHFSLCTPQGEVSIQSKSGVECLTP